MSDSVSPPPPLEPQGLEITDDHLPALYRRADKVSLAGQKGYLLLVKAELGLLALVALASSFSINEEGFDDLSLILGAVLLLLGTIATVCLGLTSYKKEWWSGRALAESIKTQAWRYMMKAEPYAQPDSDTPNLKIDQRFTDTLRSLVSQRDIQALALPPGDTTDAAITDQMRQMRMQSLAERKSVYVRDRLEDQERWYGQKAGVSSRDKKGWFAAAVVIQALAIVCSVGLLVSEQARAFLLQDSFSFNPLGLLPTLAASSLAWLQVKQHEGLAQSYRVAQTELNLIKNHVPSIHTEEDFSTFVADAENAISREHTLWRARRDSMLNLTDGPTA